MRIVGTDDGNLLVGTDDADQIYGLGGEDWLFGGGGNDLLVGGNGPDHLYGGDGIDTVDYRPSTVGLWVGFGIGRGASSDGDYLFNIENVIGSGFDDTIWASDGANTLWGWDGGDWLRGGGGIDILYGGNGDDRLDGGTGADTLYGEDGIDIADYRYSNLSVSINLAAGVDAFGVVYGLGSGGDAKN